MEAEREISASVEAEATDIIGGANLNIVPVKANSIPPRDGDGKNRVLDWGRKGQREGVTKGASQVDVALGFTAGIQRRTLMRDMWGLKEAEGG